MVEVRRRESDRPPIGEDLVHDEGVATRLFLVVGIGLGRREGPGHADIAGKDRSASGVVREKHEGVTPPFVGLLVIVADLGHDGRLGCDSPAEHRCQRAPPSVVGVLVTVPIEDGTDESVGELTVRSKGPGGIKRGAEVVPGTDVEVDAVVGSIKAGLLRGPADDTRLISITVDDRRGTLQELDPFEHRHVVHALRTQAVDRRRNATLTAKELRGGVGDARHVLARRVEAIHQPVANKLLVHDGDRLRKFAQRSIGPGRPNRVGAGVTPVFFRAHFKRG